MKDFREFFIYISTVTLALIVVFAQQPNKTVSDKTKLLVITAHRDMLSAESDMRSIHDDLEKVMQRYRLAEQAYEIANHALGSALQSANSECGVGFRFDVKSGNCVVQQKSLSEKIVK